MNQNGQSNSGLLNSFSDDCSAGVLKQPRYADKSQYKSWDFLKGEGPSSADQYYVEDKKAFKPQWKSLRHENEIRPGEPRLQYQEAKDQRQDAIKDLRSQNLRQQGAYNNFNPVTGQTVTPDGRSVPASDPWQHQRLGLRPVAVAHENGLREKELQQAHRAAGLLETRKERIASEGQPKQRPGGTVKELMKWQGAEL